MRRYVARAQWVEDLGEDVPDLGPCTVYEPDEVVAWTGLYDSNGTKIYIIDERAPIGFMRG